MRLFLPGKIPRLGDVAEDIPSVAALWGERKSAGVLKIGEEHNVYGEDALNPTGRFPRLGTQTQVVVREIEHALLRAEKR